jgi:hypothetical protein
MASIKRNKEMKVFLEENEIVFIKNCLPSTDVPKGLCPTFYHTLSYDGDLKLAKMSEAINEKFNHKE